MIKSITTEERISDIIKVILEVAQGNYDVQIELSPNNDTVDALAMGINMMIDDLKNNTDLKLQNKKIKIINQELNKAKNEAEIIGSELAEHKENLEKIVHERTKELEAKNKTLEKYNSLFVGREFRIKELKDRIKFLEDLLENKQ